MTKEFILAALMTSAMVVPASAMDVTIQDFVGKVTIVTGTDGLDVVREGKKPIKFRRSGDEIFIDGGLDHKAKSKACGGVGFKWDLGFGGRNTEGNTRLKDYPDIVLSVPNGSNLTVVDSAVELDAAATLGMADLDLGGCFDISIAAADTLRLEKSGSGNINIASAGTIDLEKSGSGNVDIGKVGRFDLEQSGSGDLDIDSVNGPVTIAKSGSGNIDLGSLDGNFMVEKSGSGNVDIAAGSIPDLSIQKGGSGNIDIDAAVGDAYVRASGSGNVYIKSISGALDQTVSGSGKFSRGDD